MNLISEDYLMHYGVKGMKWGVRHDPYKSARGSFHRGMSKVYSLNERTYRRLGNNTLASMNAAAKNEQLKKAQQADADKKKNIKAIERAKNQKNAAKLEKYQSKLIKKADKNAGNYRREARDTKNEIDDIKKMGGKSAYWKQHAREEADNYARSETQRLKKQGMSDESARFWGTMSGGAKYAGMTSNWSNQSYINNYVSDLTKNHANSIRLAKQYTNNRNSLMNYKVSSSTKKKDIKKIYRNNLHFYE